MAISHRMRGLKSPHLIVDSRVEGLCSARSTHRKCDWNSIAVGDVGHHHVELVEADGAGSQPRVGEGGRGLPKKYLDRGHNTIGLLDHLPCRDVGRYGPKTHAI